MQIQQLAALTNTSVEQLDLYEERGLLQPQRTGDGRRSYSTLDIARVDTINELAAKGFPSTVIHAMLATLTPPADD